MDGKIEGVGEIINATIFGQSYVLRRNLKWILAE
jgi:hypothetical protein